MNANALRFRAPSQRRALQAHELRAVTAGTQAFHQQQGLRLPASPLFSEVYVESYHMNRNYGARIRAGRQADFASTVSRRAARPAFTPAHVNIGPTAAIFRWKEKSSAA